MQYDEYTNYSYSNTDFYEYNKPKDVFVCCYLSPTNGKIYSDGYGLNFYTHEYGYYEYCEHSIIEQN